MGRCDATAAARKPISVHRVDDYFARALGAARSGDPVAAEKDVGELARIVAALKAAKNDYWVTEVEVQRLGAAAWTAYAKGNKEEAVTLMRSAADLEDKSEKSAVTPGRIIPARELLGDIHPEMNRAAEALQAFETSENMIPTASAVSMARAKPRRWRRSGEGEELLRETPRARAKGRYRAA